MGNNNVRPEHTQTDPGPSTSDYQPDDQEEVKKQDDIEELVEGITIAGIEDAYKSKIPAEKAMFVLAIILFFYAMIHSSVLIGDRYVEHGSIEVNQSLVFDQVAPFPNVTICLPGMYNKHVRDYVVFPDRIVQRMQRLGVTKKDVIDIIESVSHERVFASQVLRVIATKVFDATLDNPNLPFDAMQQPCPEVLSNCALGGQIFNCCESAQFMYYFSGSCWNIDVNRIDNLAKTKQVMGGEFIEPSKIVFSGLAFDVTTDPASAVMDEDTFSDGLVIHIDTLPSMVSSPTVVPIGADAQIQLSPPTNIQEIDNCVPVDKLPKLKRYNFYDSHRVACLSDQINELIQIKLGCSGVPILTFIPDNATRCPANIIYLIASLVADDAPPMPKEVQKMVNSFYNRDFIRSFFYGNICPMPCTRWSYPILSNSYGYIQYQHEHQPNDSSLSRVRVFFPEAYYHLYTEEKVNMFYLAFCEMGGVWGVYLGFSIVSVFQAAAYGVIIIWKKKKKKKAAAGDAIQMKNVGWV